MLKDRTPLANSETRITPVTWATAVMLTPYTLSQKACDMLEKAEAWSQLGGPVSVELIEIGNDFSQLGFRYADL